MVREICVLLSRVLYRILLNHLDYEYSNSLRQTSRWHGRRTNLQYNGHWEIWIRRRNQLAAADSGKDKNCRSRLQVNIKYIPKLLHCSRVATVLRGASTCCFLTTDAAFLPPPLPQCATCIYSYILDLPRACIGATLTIELGRAIRRQESKR